MALDRINATALLDGGVTSADLATQTGNVDFADNARIRLGDSQDLQIFHDGSNSWINEIGTGQLILAGEDVRITTPNAGEFMATFGVNGAATLYYDNAAKLATTATGVDVTGRVTADGLTVDGTSRFNDYIHFGGSISTPSTAAAIYRPADNQLAFSTANTERMRINNVGRLHIGTGVYDPSSSVVGVRISGTNGDNFWISSAGVTSAYNQLAFLNPNGFVGFIQTSGTSTSYVTSSDYRLKENVISDWDATTRLKQLNPVRFNFIADADTTVDGFLAHEVQSIVPEAITGTKDGLEVWKDGEELPDGVSVGDNKLDDDGNTIPYYQGIDQGKLVPLLVKSLQEALTKIDEQSLKIGELETRIASLEAN